MGLLMIDGQTIHVNDDIELLPTEKIRTNLDATYDPPDGDFGLHFSSMEYTIEIKPYPWQLRRFRRHVLGWKAKGPMRNVQMWRAQHMLTGRKAIAWEWKPNS